MTARRNKKSKTIWVNLCCGNCAENLQALAGERVEVYQPGPFGGNVPTDGAVTLEGPHYPEPHRWYAQAVLKGGSVVKVK